MKVSLNWLTDYLDLSGIEPQKLAELVTERVAEVEHVVTAGCNIPKVVTGKIEKIEAIEGADKIRLATVNVVGEKLQIVCGAQNIHEGAVVPVALVGAELPGGFKIEKRKMKGITSHGMICSEKELGLAEKSEGIMLLPEKTPLGVPFTELCPGDTIFEIDNHAINHRPDLFSQVGFAREIAVLLGRNARLPRLDAPRFDNKLDVEVTDPTLCPRYCGLRITGIQVGPSSEKIRQRLESCGVRAINNVVDATNYVMLELGQPMHAFDAKKLVGGWVLVRRAKSGELLKTLDGNEQELSKEMLVIADAEKPIALAGVMGGANSEVTSETTEIILEAATFAPASVRRTSIALGLRSESSLRFEKQLDPELPPRAMMRFIHLLRETCPELKVESGSDRVNFRSEKRIVPLPLKQLEKKLGRAVSADQVRKILIALEFKLTPVAHGEVIQSFEVEVPSFRAGKDVSETADLIEEVARHSGYNTIPVEFPWVQLEAPEFDAGRELTREIQDAFVASGYSEALTLSMLSQAAIEKTPERVAEALKIKNPPSEDFRYLRTSLLNTLLLAAEGNSKRLKSFRLFEVSNVFATNGEEKRQAVALCIGEEQSFLCAKGAAEQLFGRLKVPVSFVSAVGESDFAHPGRVLQIKSNGRIIGEVAQLHPAIQKNFELPESAYVFVDLEALLKLKRAVVTSKALPKFPGIARDIAVVVSEKTLASEVESAILGADDRIADLKLFDAYSGKGIEVGKRSLAFSFEIRDSEKTLEDSEAEAVMQKIIAAVEGKGGSLRS